MLTNDELQELCEKYCRSCGSQYCAGMFDETFKDGCPYYKAAINGKLIFKQGLDVRQLYDDFVEHINAMTAKELIESARRAEEMTASCDD